MIWKWRTPSLVDVLEVMDPPWLMFWKWRTPPKVRLVDVLEVADPLQPPVDVWLECKKHYKKWQKTRLLYTYTTLEGGPPLGTISLKQTVCV